MAGDLFELQQPRLPTEGDEFRDSHRLEVLVGDGYVSLSWYVQPEVAVVVLGLWLLLAILFGVKRFERADLS